MTGKAHIPRWPKVDFAVEWRPRVLMPKFSEFFQFSYPVVKFVVVVGHSVRHLYAVARSEKAFFAGVLAIGSKAKMPVTVRRKVFLIAKKIGSLTRGKS